MRVEARPTLKRVRANIKLAAATMIISRVCLHTLSASSARSKTPLKRLGLSCWGAQDGMEKPGFHIVISDGVVSQSYWGCYGDVADHKCVVSIKKTVHTST